MVEVELEVEVVVGPAEVEEVEEVVVVVFAQEVQLLVPKVQTLAVLSQVQ